MSLGNIIRKELKELLTPTTLIPIVVMALLFASMGSMFGGIEERVGAKPKIGLINEDAGGNLSGMAVNVLRAQAEIIYEGASVEDGLRAVGDGGGAALLVIPSNFSSNILNNTTGTIGIYWILKGLGIMESISSGSVEGLLYSVDQEISRQLIMQGGSVDPGTALHPTTRNETTIVKGREMGGISPGAIGGMLSSQSFLVPFIVMMLIIMAGSMVISSMGMEKENKTLETLLTLPVRRSSIVTGKIAGSAIVGLIMAVVYMMGFGYYMGSLQSSNLNLADYGLALGPVDYLLVGISLFMTLLAGLSLCMLLGTFASNYKTAQTLTFPVTMLAMIPMFIIMFLDFDTLPLGLKVVVFAIPFSHPMMAIRALLFGDYLLVIGGIAYVTIFAALMIYLAVRIFKSDRLLTGISRLRGLSRMSRSMPILNFLTSRKKR